MANPNPGLPSAMGVPPAEAKAGAEAVEDAGLDYPIEAYAWMTDELRELLAAIPGPHERKKRRTVVVLAFAEAMQEGRRAIFRQSAKRGICSGRIWYQKWQYDPAIWAAYVACLRRCLEFLDADTVRIEEHFLRIRRRQQARYTADVPVALAQIMANPQERAPDRIEAALALFHLDENPRPGGRTLIEVQGEVNAIDLQLRQELARLGLPGAPASTGPGPGQEDTT